MVKISLWGKGLSSLLLLLLQMKNSGQKMRMTHTLDTYVICVVGDVWVLGIWRDMWEYILERDLMFVVIVENLSRSNTS